MPQNIPSDVQSASAGTTCQTTASNFAYIVTGTVLGVIVALCFAAIMLFYSVMASGFYRYDSARYMGTGPSDPGYGYLDDGTGDDNGNSWGDDQNGWQGQQGDSVDESLLSNAQNV